MSFVNSETVQDMVVKQAEGPYQLIACTSQIVSSFLVNQKVEPSKITDVIDDVYKKLKALEANSAADNMRLRPAVPIADSISDDFITCLLRDKTSGIGEKNRLGAQALITRWH